MTKSRVDDTIGEQREPEVFALLVMPVKSLMNPIFYSKVYKICKGKIATLTEFLNRNEVQQIAQTLISPSQNHSADYPKKGGDGDKTLKLCITLLEESHDTCRTLFATI